MSTNFTIVLILFSIIIWGMVSYESIKPSEKINWKRMIILLSYGSLSTLILIIPLFRSLPF